MHKYCTIVSANYLPQALTLAESFREVYPGVILNVLVIDLDWGSIKDHSNIHYLFVSDLSIETSQVRKMQAYYDVVEFATAMKPTLLLHLLRDSNETVSYIDPDIYIFSQVSHAQAIGEETGLAITPHRVTAMPFYPASPKELSFLRVGIYNLGFICVGKKATSVLQWWEKRLRWHATQFDGLPYFTDQKWADFFPTFTQCKILDHKGYNLAFWNIDERPLSVRNSEFFAGDEKLVFVHFSQMSSELMKYGKSSLWGTWLSTLHYDSESISIVNNLSRIYSGRLKQSAAAVETLGLVPIFKFPSGGRFARAKMIQRDIKGLTLTKRWEFLKFLSSPKLIFLLEKSDALTGLRIGFIKDLARIKSRLKRD
jgi:hypothetical protein